MNILMSDLTIVLCDLREGMIVMKIGSHMKRILIISNVMNFLVESLSVIQTYFNLPFKPFLKYLTFFLRISNYYEFGNLYDIFVAMFVVTPVTLNICVTERKEAYMFRRRKNVDLNMSSCLCVRTTT